MIKNYKNIISDYWPGLIIEGVNSGLPSYVVIPEIKELFIDGQWIPNPGYDLQKVKEQKLYQIESKLIDESIKLDKANSLNLQTQIVELTLKIAELNKQKADINALK